MDGETVEFMALVQRVAEESYLSLKELMKKTLKGDELGRKPSYDEMKIDLLRFIDKTRQRLLGLYVTRAADSLFFLHKELQHAAHPIHDIPSAIEVFRTGIVPYFTVRMCTIEWNCDLNVYFLRPFKSEMVKLLFLCIIASRCIRNPQLKLLWNIM